MRGLRTGRPRWANGVAAQVSGGSAERDEVHRDVGVGEFRRRPKRINAGDDAAAGNK